MLYLNLFLGIICIIVHRLDVGVNGAVVNCLDFPFLFRNLNVYIPLYIFSDVGVNGAVVNRLDFYFFIYKLESFIPLYIS